MLILLLKVFEIYSDKKLVHGENQHLLKKSLFIHLYIHFHHAYVSLILLNITWQFSRHSERAGWLQKVYARQDWEVYLKS